MNRASKRRRGGHAATLAHHLSASLLSLSQARKQRALNITLTAELDRVSARVDFCRSRNQGAHTAAFTAWAQVQKARQNPTSSSPSHPHMCTKHTPTSIDACALPLILFLASPCEFLYPGGAGAGAEALRVEGEAGAAARGGGGREVARGVHAGGARAPLALWIISRRNPPLHAQLYCHALKLTPHISAQTHSSSVRTSSGWTASTARPRRRPRP